MITTLISFAVVLGILIFIHELGHFAVAKFSGVGVETFSLGMGPKLIGIKRGETEYRISIVPFGGYVKMVGFEDSKEEGKEIDENKSFMTKPLYKRAAIVFAGAFMNIALAAVLFPLVFMIGMDVPAYIDDAPQIAYVVTDGAAFKAGLKKGDIISGINGEEVKTWEELYRAVTLHHEKAITFKVKRGASVIEATISSLDEGLGFYPPAAPRIGNVMEAYPAEKAGLKQGDIVKRINGIEITHWVELQEAIRKDGKELTLLVQRDEKEFQVKLTPRFNEDAKYYVLGISQKDETIVKKYGFFESIKLGIGKALELTVLLFTVLKGLIVGVYSVKTLGGPIMIAQFAGQAAKIGFVTFILFLASLSLQLGIINLFPIPVLDGGHLVFFLIEWIKGKPLSEKAMNVSQQIGWALLIILMVFVTLNDILRTMGWG